VIYCYYGCNWHGWKRWPVEAKSEISDGSLLLLIAFLFKRCSQLQQNVSLSRFAQSEVFGWSRIFCPTPTPDDQLDHFYITLLNWEFLLNWYRFFWKFVETEISCCVPRFSLILTAKFHSRYVKESEILERSESEILESRESESDVLPPTPQPCH